MSSRSSPRFPLGGAEVCEGRWIARDSIAIDPGLGFGKNVRGEYALIANAAPPSRRRLSSRDRRVRKELHRQETGQSPSRDGAIRNRCGWRSGGAPRRRHCQLSMKLLLTARPSQVYRNAISYRTMIRSLFAPRQCAAVPIKPNEPPRDPPCGNRHGGGQVFNRGGHRHRVVIGRTSGLSVHDRGAALTAGSCRTASM